MRGSGGAEVCVTDGSAGSARRARRARGSPGSRRCPRRPPAPHSWCSTPPAGRAPPLPPASGVFAPCPRHLPTAHRRLDQEHPAEKDVRMKHCTFIAGAILNSSAFTFSPLAQCFRVSAHFFMALRCFQRCCFLCPSLSGTALSSRTAASSTPRHHLSQHCSAARTEGHR